MRRLPRTERRLKQLPLRARRRTPARHSTICSVSSRAGLTRRSFLLSTPVGLAASSGYALGFEPQWLETTSTKVALPGLSAPIRLLHLADFHVSGAVPFQLIERAIDLGLACRPDIVCLTGDFITDNQAIDQPRYLSLLRRLTSAAPVLAVLGNHDGGPWVARAVGGFPNTKMVRTLLGAAGITLLDNASVALAIGSSRVNFAGVSDLWNGDVDLNRAFASPHDGPTVLLAHNPDTKDLAADFPWQLMLSGHTHGGQVLIPGVGPRFVPVRDKRFISGLKEWCGRRVYITRGVGSLGGIRINCRPEVTLLDLTARPA